MPKKTQVDVSVPTKPKRAKRVVSVAEQADPPAGVSAEGQVWHAVASEFLNRIRLENARVDKLPTNITVIIPAYLKDEQDVTWLREAIESIIAQTIFVRCLIIENGSFRLPDLNAFYIAIMHSDKGLSKARNAGIRASETEFFFPLDANDWLPPNALEIALNRMPEKGFLYGSTMLFRGERGTGDQHHYEAKPYDFQEIMKMVYFPNGALQRKADWETIGGYREDLPFLEDWDYWLTAGERGICGTAIQDTLYWYRQHDGIVGENKHTPAWEDTKRLIQSYHADIYKGVYPPMCCGNKALAPAVPYSPPSVQTLMPGADGMLLITYLGGNVGKMPYYGPVTGTRYVVSGVHRNFYIDVRDAITGSTKNPGFLEMVDHGNPLFREVV